MKNAFEILGATPLDDGEKLKELLEEQQLLLDDDKELAEAYASLTSPKKRVKHEIEYFASEAFAVFNEVFFEEDAGSAAYETESICSGIITLGRWFEEGADEVFDEINDNRAVSGFASLNNNSTVKATINEMKAACVDVVNKDFDGYTENELIEIFTAIVEQPDFSSFFVDELIAHYEIRIEDSLRAKEKQSTAAFDEVERACNAFIGDDSSVHSNVMKSMSAAELSGVVMGTHSTISHALSGKVSTFKNAIMAWDKLAKPLKVNARQRGASHNVSAGFVHGVRNRVIDLCNRSQKSVSDLIDQMNLYAKLMNRDYSGVTAGMDINSIFRAKEKLPQKIADSVVFTDYLLKIIDILIDAFADIEATAEQLKKDRKDIAALKASLSQFNSQIKHAQAQAPTPRYTYQKSSGCYIATAVYGSYDCPQVWVLRRYRDNDLKSNWLGKLFIKFYYAVSPLTVKLFGKTRWFNSFWKKRLDKKIEKLKTKGYLDTPYND